MKTEPRTSYGRAPADWTNTGPLAFVAAVAEPEGALHLLISGVVQGVGYRNWAQKQAAALGLRGWVRNLTDGRVELWAEGAQEALATLEVRCHSGPRHASVTEVSKETGAPTGTLGFVVRSTASL